MRPIDADNLRRRVCEIFLCAEPSSAEERRFAIVLGLIDSEHTIAPPPNAPLTLEDLREMGEPVWVKCGVTPFTPDGGYYCLCQNGYITTPSGMQYMAEDIPHWKFYRRKPEEGTT